MRPIDELARLFTDPDPLVQRYALILAEDLRVTFEISDLVDLFREGLNSKDKDVRLQAERGLRKVLPMRLGQKYNLRQATTTTKAGTWTEYNIDRAELDKLKKLGKAQTIDFAAINLDMMVSSALHLLGPCIDQACRLAVDGDPEIRLEATRALGQVNVPQALDVLAIVGKDENFAVQAAASLADLSSRKALLSIIELVEHYRGRELFRDLLIELRNFEEEDDAFQTVLDALPVADNPLKSRIAYILGAFHTNQSEAVLIDFLSEADEEVQLYAVDSLGRIGGISCIKALGKLFGISRNGLVRQAVIRALGSIGAPEGTDFVAQGLKDAKPQVRAQALESLVRLRIPDQDLFKLVFPVVQDNHHIVSSNAILALAPIDSSMALQKVFTFLRQTDIYARAQGVFCLGYIQNSTALNLLKQIIQRDSCELVTVQATKALAKYKADDAVPLLLTLLSHRQTPVRKMTALVLGHFGGDKSNLEIFNKVAARLKDEFDPSVRITLMETLANVAEPSQHLVLSKLLDKQNPEITAKVIEGLDLLGNIDSVGSVEPFLSHRHPEVKAQAALALWNQGEMRVIDHLVEDFLSGDREQAKAALKALYNIGLSLKRLSDAHKYPLLLSELTDNSNSEEYAKFQAHYTQSMLASSRKPRKSRRKDFDFQAAVCGEDNSLVLDIPVPTANDDAPDQSSESESSGRPQRLDLSSPTGGSVIDLGASNGFSELDLDSTPLKTAKFQNGFMPLPDHEQVSPESSSNIDFELGTTTEVDETALERLFATSSREEADIQVTEPLAPDESGAADIPVEIQLENAITMLFQGKTFQALEMVQKIVEKTNKAAARFLLVKIFLTLKRTKEAEEHLRILAAEDCSFVNPLLVLVGLCQQRKANRQVIEHFVHAARLTLDLLGKQLDMTFELLQKGDMESLPRFVKELSVQMPVMESIHKRTGLLQLKAGNFDAAFGQLLLAHICDPYDGEVSLRLAKAALRSGRHDFARHLCDVLAANSQNSPKVLEELRQIIEKLGERQR